MPTVSALPAIVSSSLGLQLSCFVVAAAVVLESLLEPQAATATVIASSTNGSRKRRSSTAETSQESGTGESRSAFRRAILTGYDCA